MSICGIIINMKKRDTKKEILAVSKKYFYRNGYSGTYLNMIAKELDIDKQLINYHFGSKEKLAIAVRDEITETIRLSFYNAALSVDVRSIYYANSAFTLWLPTYLIGDENARRFFEELLISEFDIEVLKKQYLSAVSYEFKKTDPAETRSPKFSEYVISYQSARWLMHYYCRGDIDMDSEEFERRYYYLNCDPFFSDHKRLERIYTGAKALLDNLDITIKPDFNISIEIKK